MFDEADITSWIDRTNTSIKEARHARALPTPPPSLGSKIPKHKRSASMDFDYQDHEATPRSRKRNRKQSYGPASLSEAPSSVQFSRPESSARSNSPVKDLLNELRSAKPTIDYQQLDGVNLPAAARELIQKLNTDFGQAYVPLALKAKLEEAATSAQFAKESIYNRNKTSVEVDSLWKEVMEIYDEARCCKVYSRDEGAWCSKVVQPLMTLALDKESIFQWENITTQGFDRCFLPRTNYLPISKKADLAWIFSRKHYEVAPLYQRLSLAGQGTSLSHLMDPYTSKLAVYNGFEIKKTAGSEDESLAQLAIFLACLLRNTKDLRRRAQRKGGNTLVREGRPKSTTPVDDGGSGPAAQENRDNEHIEVLPVLGWTIIGHHWSTYIAWSSPEDGENVHIIGPISMLAVDTDSILGVFKLLSLLQLVAEYGSSVYWPWLKRNVLEPLAESGNG